MKKKIIKVISALLVVVITLTSTPLSGFIGLELPEWIDLSIMSSAAETSGTCGENVTWSFDDTTGTLTISGTGAMHDYNVYNVDNRPWENYEDDIETIVINNGVTTIGDYVFFHCESLTSVSIPDGVTTIGMCTFSYCTSLTSVSIPDSVITIGYCAFSNCNLTNITIPESVTTIGDFAFSDCNLTNITIPESVTTIGDFAFECCYSLTSITVDSNNKYYSSDEYGVLFNKDKTTLIQYPVGNTRTSYSIPCSVTTIISRAFYGSKNLSSVTLSSNWSTVGGSNFSPFYGCAKLTEIIFPDGMTKVPDYAFSYCESLISVIISDSVTIIGMCAFSDCTSLTSVIIPDSVTIIGDKAFYYCYRLLDIHYSGTEEQWNAISIGSDNEGLTNGTIYFNSVGECPHYSYSFYETAPTCTESGFTTYICELCGNVYEETIEPLGHDLIIDNEVVAPDCTNTGLTEGSHCSRCDYSVAQEEIPALGHDLVIDNEAVAPDCINTGFTEGSHCSRCDYSVAQEEIPALGHNYDSVVTEPTCIEKGYTTYTCETCGDSYISDETYSFEHSFVNGICTVCGECNFVYETSGFCGENVYWSYDVETHVLTISGTGPMYDCHSAPWSWTYDINSVVIEDGVTSIGAYAFQNCTSLTSVSIPDSVTLIDMGAFCNCSILTSITIPDSVTTIGYYAFEHCMSLTNITIPDCVTMVGSSVLDDTAYYKDKNNWENNVLYNGNHLIEANSSISGSYEVKDGTITIAAYAFSSCTSLTSVTIPDSVMTIGNFAYSDCTNLMSVIIPNSVTLIEYGAFDKCTSLSDIYYCSTEEQWNAIEIGDRNDSLLNATLHYHNYITEEISSPTCTEPGTTTYTCEFCNDTYTEETEALGHNYTSVVTAPTCTETGFTTYTCSICGDLYTADETLETGHTYEQVFVKQSTCVKTGFIEYECTICYESYREVIPALNHTYEDGTSALVEIPGIVPTCLGNGYTEQVVCQICNMITTQRQIIPATGHNYDTVVTAPTCTEKGYTTYTCLTCGDSYTADETEPSEHLFVDGTCTVCGNNKMILEVMTSQIRFSINDTNEYLNKFDVRTRVKISDENFKELVAVSNDKVAENVDKIGFVYTLAGENFSAESAQTVATGGSVAGYVDAPVKYIQDADGYYMFTCLIKDIPDSDKEYTLTAYAYICINGKWYFSEEPMNADFNNLYSTYYPLASEKYGW